MAIQKVYLTVEQISSHFPGYSIDQIESVFNQLGGKIQESSLSIFATALESLDSSEAGSNTSKRSNRGGKLANAKRGGIERPAAPGNIAPAATSIDSQEYKTRISNQLAQPLIDANAQVVAIEQGLAAAAAHLQGRKQQAFDNFYQTVGAEVETQELTNFFSQIPAELAAFFPSTAGN